MSNETITYVFPNQLKKQTIFNVFDDPFFFLCPSLINVSFLSLLTALHSQFPVKDAFINIVFIILLLYKNSILFL